MLEAAGYECQRCGAVDVELQVHHLTYARLGREDWEDLKVVCSPCHAIEDREREERARWAEAYQRELARWAFEQFGKDWRLLNRSGYIEREFALHLEALNLDTPEWSTGEDEDLGSLLAGLFDL